MQYLIGFAIALFIGLRSWRGHGYRTGSGSISWSAGPVAVHRIDVCHRGQISWFRRKFPRNVAGGRLASCFWRSAS